MSLTDFLFGSTAYNAAREARTYNPEFGGRQKDLGDYLGDFFTGQGRILDKATEEKYVKNLKNDYGNRLSELRQYGLTDKVIDKNTTRTELDNLIEKHQRAVNLNKDIDLKAAQVGYIPPQNASYQEKLQGLADYKTGLKEKETNKIYDREDKIRNEDKVERLEQQMRQDKINEANRQREFQITQMQNALNNRRLDIQESRDYRKDRQVAIMQIMQGFANMGKAFAA